MNLIDHLRRQFKFSAATFGPPPQGATVHGVLDHIRKEIAEIEASPNDLEEWIDVAMLAFDGAYRSGHTPEQIAAALEAKQTKNEGRAWPDWRTHDPDKGVEHIRG